VTWSGQKTCPNMTVTFNCIPCVNLSLWSSEILHPKLPGLLSKTHKMLKTWSIIDAGFKWLYKLQNAMHMTCQLGGGVDPVQSWCDCSWCDCWSNVLSHYPQLCSVECAIHCILNIWECSNSFHCKKGLFTVTTSSKSSTHYLNYTNRSNSWWRAFAWNILSYNVFIHYLHWPHIEVYFHKAHSSVHSNMCVAQCQLVFRKQFDSKS
jgi:hypothetical protein